MNIIKRFTILAAVCFLQISTIKNAWGQGQILQTGVSLTELSNNACNGFSNWSLNMFGSTTGYTPDSNAITLHVYFGDGKDTVVQTALYGTVNNGNFQHTLNHEYPAGNYHILVRTIAIDNNSDSTFNDLSVYCRSIQGKLYTDKNTNCIFDAGDMAATPGVSVYLIDANNVFIQTAYTDANGNYSFGISDTTKTYHVKYGFYTDVICPVGNDYTINTFPAFGKDFALKDTNANSISGRIYVDKNSNCVFDQNDVAKPNINVKLIYAFNVIDNTITDANGYYIFHNTSPTSSYTIALDTAEKVLCPANYNPQSGYGFNPPTNIVDFSLKQAIAPVAKEVHSYFNFKNTADCNAFATFQFYPVMQANGYSLGDQMQMKFFYGDGKDTSFNYTVNSTPYVSASFYIGHQYGVFGSFSPKFLVIGPDGKRDSVEIPNAIVLKDTCGHIAGKAYVDVNANCMFDGNDIPLANIPVYVKPSNGGEYVAAYTDNAGDYNAPLANNDTYAVSINHLPYAYGNYIYNFNCPSAGEYMVNSFPSPALDFSVKQEARISHITPDMLPVKTCTVPSTQEIHIFYSNNGFPIGSVFGVKVAFGDGTDTTFNTTADSVVYMKDLMLKHAYTISGYYSLQFIITDPNSNANESDVYNMYEIGESCSTISGKVYLDENGDCQFNGNDKPAPWGTAALFLYDNNQFTEVAWADSLGNYSFNAAKGAGHNYRVQLGSTNAVYNLCPASGAISIGSLPSYGNNFAQSCQPGFDLAGYIWGWGFRPGNEGYIVLGGINRFCQDVNATFKFVKSPLLNIINVNPPPDATFGDTLVWHENAFTSNNYFYAYMQVETSTGATLNDSIHLKLLIDPTAGDMTPSDNIVDYVSPIMNSWDPNMKTGTVNGKTSRVSSIEADAKELTYTVFFQNTGNAAAYNIFVMDTLDKNLDPLSLRIVNASHAMKAEILAGNVLKFNFHNIMLIDSSHNEPGSHGYVTYTAKLKPGLAIGTTIKNTGYIYFDYNPAVVTNTTAHQLANKSLGITQMASNKTIQAYPNPASDQLTILLTNETVGADVEILDMVGNTVLKTIATEAIMKMDLARLPEGIYILQVNKGGEQYKNKISVVH